MRYTMIATRPPSAAVPVPLQPRERSRASRPLVLLLMLAFLAACGPGGEAGPDADGSDGTAASAESAGGEYGAASGVVPDGGADREPVPAEGSGAPGGADGDVSGDSSAPAEGAGAANLLAGTSWRLVELQSMDDATGARRPEDSSAYTMRLGADGTLAMRLDCNRATGTWTAEPSEDGPGGGFELGSLASTRALCPPPSLGQALSSQAEYIRSYLVDGRRLYLSLMADGGIQVWQKMEEEDGASEAGVPPSPEEGGPRAWVVPEGSGGLALRTRPATDADAFARFSAGALLDNRGCRSVGEEAWCDVQELGGGARGFVPVASVEPAVSPDGSVPMGPDDSSIRAGRNDFDATGMIPCSQVPGQPMTQCRFSVARAGGGYATVVIRRPLRGTRILFFSMGRAIGVSTAESDSTGAFQAREEAGLHRIRIGDERYEIPQEVVLGG